MIGKINDNGPKIGPTEFDEKDPRIPCLFALQHSLYIAKEALATGLRMRLNVPPFVRRSVKAPAGSS